MAGLTQLGLSRIAQIHVTVVDLERAVAFYRDALGMRLLFQVPNMAFFDCAGIRLMLGVAERQNDRYASILYYHVPNIHTAHQTLVDRGVTFEGPPHKVADLGDHELWLAFFRDIDANVLALSSEVAKQ